MFRIDQSDRRWLALASAAVLALGAGFALPAGAARTISDAAVSCQIVDADYALVQLNGEPLATYSKSKPAKGKKIDFDHSNVKSYRAQLAALRNDFKQWLRANAPKAKVTGEFDISLNAVAVKLHGEPLSKIAAAPQALRAQYQGLYYPTATDPDVALISAPQASAQGGGTARARARVKVAIVDKGTAATHPR